MYLPQQNRISRNGNYINAFGGYNHKDRINDAECYDMKNMTMDRYPVLSVREKRNYKLKIASNEFEPVEAVLEQRFVEESLSKRYAVYKLQFDVMEGNTYEIGYVVDDTYVERCEQEIRFLNENNGIKHSNQSARSFEAPKGYEKAVVTVTAYWNMDEEAWKEENLDLFVHDLGIQRHNETIRGMLLKNGSLAYLIKNTLYWNGQTFDLSDFDDGIEEQQLVSYGAYILIFPMGTYINTNDTKDYGPLGASFESTEKIVYSMCSLDGSQYTYTVSESAPEEPEDGQYWMKRSSQGDALYQWSETMAMWTAVLTTYVKIKVTGNADCFSVFEENDAIFIENSSVQALNGVNNIVKMGEIEENGVKSAYIVVTGVIPEIVEQTSAVRFERKIPLLDHVCVSNNRVWGCHYGITEEGMVNEIYACKLGDPKNWYSYLGTAQDSYALSLGDDGEFTAAYTYQGYPLFFKENNVYKIYGNYPAAYQLITYDCRGVQKGSSKGIAIVDEYLVYKSINDICVFDGNYPVSLSEKLGNVKYSQAAAGSYMSKYYISMKDESGKFSIFVYDFKTSLWVKDDDLEVEEFISTKSGELYGRTKVGIIRFGNDNKNLGLSKEDAEEGKVQWYIESGNIGLDSPKKKYIKNIRVRAAVYPGSKMKMEVYYDDSGKWHEHWIETGNNHGDGKIKTYEIKMISEKCDTMRMRISGVGKAEIYSIYKEVEDGEK